MINQKINFSPTSRISIHKNVTRAKLHQYSIDTKTESNEDRNCTIQYSSNKEKIYKNRSFTHQKQQNSIILNPLSRREIKRNDQCHRQLKLTHQYKQHDDDINNFNKKGSIIYSLQQKEQQCTYFNNIQEQMMNLAKYYLKDQQNNAKVIHQKQIAHLINILIQSAKKCLCFVLKNYNHENQIQTMLTLFSQHLQNNIITQQQGKTKPTKFNQNQSSIQEKVIDKNLKLMEVHLLKKQYNSTIKKLNFIKLQLNQKEKELTLKMKQHLQLQAHIEQLKKFHNHIQDQVKEVKEVLQFCKKEQQKIANIQTFNSYQQFGLENKNQQTIQKAVRQYGFQLQIRKLSQIHKISIFQKIQSDEVFIQLDLLASNANSLNSQKILGLVDKTKKIIRQLESQSKQIKARIEDTSNQFMQYLDHWTRIWTSKQQNLQNLRKKFAMDSRKLRKYISTMGKQTFCYDCQKKISNIYNNIHELYNKIEQNYKLGHSLS